MYQFECKQCFFGIQLKSRYVYIKIENEILQIGSRESEWDTLTTFNVPTQNTIKNGTDFHPIWHTLRNLERLKIVIITMLDAILFM